jgi:EpsI family protein
MEEIKAQEDLQPLEQAAMPDSPGLSDGAQLLAGADSAPAHTPSADWKRFRVPMAVLTMLMIGVLLAIQYMPRVAARPGEKTLHRVPAQIGEWHLIQEYEMSAEAANELKPDEYIARIYVNSDGEEVDFTILAGSHTGAFHNPQVCFRVQNWEFAENESITLNVPEREPIPARFVRLISLDGQRREAVGIYFYSTPMGYRDDTSTARIFLLLSRLGAGSQQRAYFIRFLKTATGNPERDRESVKRFAEQVLTAMRTTNPEVVR